VCHRRDKAIPSTGDSRDVASAPAPIPQRLPQAGDMDPKISLVHGHIRPNARDQLPLSDDFSGALNQGDQRIERTATELEWLVPYLELPFDRKQAERAK
jgi:hypothetical protein